jgi:carboxyl-terminal processing protease
MTLTKRAIVLGTTAIMATAVTVSLVGVHLSRGNALLKETPKDLIEEVWQVIDNSYVDGTFNQQDWRSIRRDYLGREYVDKKQAYLAIREMLKKLNDPYTRFLDPEEFKSLKIDTSGELIGVGIQLAADEKTKKLTVISPIEGSPASKAGVLSKDIIVKIDEKSTDGMDVNDAVKLIRGEVGTAVKLTMQRGGKEIIEYNLKRDRIELHPVRFNVQKTTAGDTGYIRLTQFSAPAVKDMGNAMKSLEKQNVTGYILDLRSNPGGLLQASVEIGRQWIDQGGIVSTVDRKGQGDRESANNTALTNKPVVVLVDGGSASASEILSGALQDNKRAKIVGLRTFGKGLVQSVRGLGDNESGLAVTIAKYLTPNGRDINKHGIDPDVEIKLTEAQQKELLRDRDKIGTPVDPQFAKAVEVLAEEIKKTKASK